MSLNEMEAGLDHVRAAPADGGELTLLVRRPEVEEREILERGDLDLDVGLLGDCWATRGSSRTNDGRPQADAQVTLMSSRAAEIISGSSEPEAWTPAGDQLFVDLDIGVENLPAGTRLAIGEAVVEVTPEPHLGCGKFSRRFGVDAVKFVNSEVGRSLRLRGVNTRVIRAGRIEAGNAVRKLRGSDV